MRDQAAGGLLAWGDGGDRRRGVPDGGRGGGPARREARDALRLREPWPAEELPPGHQAPATLPARRDRGPAPPCPLDRGGTGRRPRGAWRPADGSTPRRVLDPGVGPTSGLEGGQGLLEALRLRVVRVHRAREAGAARADDGQTKSPVD